MGFDRLGDNVKRFICVSKVCFNKCRTALIAVGTFGMWQLVGKRSPADHHFGSSLKKRSCDRSTNSSRTTRHQSDVSSHHY